MCNFLTDELKAMMGQFLWGKHVPTHTTPGGMCSTAVEHTAAPVALQAITDNKDAPQQASLSDAWWQLQMGRGISKMLTRS